MSKLLCMFRPHRWRWSFNCIDESNAFGVYQCTTCKEVSIGSPRDYRPRMRSAYAKTPRGTALQEGKGDDA